MHLSRRLALLLVAVALALPGLALGLVTAPAATAQPGDDPSDPGGDEPVLVLRDVGLGPEPLYGQRQSLSFRTNLPAQETVATVYSTPQPDSPLTDLLATIDREGAISWATAPRFVPGQDHWVRLQVSKETQTVVSNRIRFTVAPVPSTVSFEQTTLAAHERLRVRPVPGTDTGVPAGGEVTLTSGTTPLGTAPVVGGVATFRLEPGTRDVIAAYSGGDGWLGSQAGATVSVAKAAVTTTAADPELEVAAHEPVSLDLSFASSEPLYAPGGAYTLLARPAGSTDPAQDVVVEEHGYDAASLRIDLTAWAAEHVGRWDLYFLTGETARLAPSSTRVAGLRVDRGRVPTAIDLPAPTRPVAFGDPRARVAGTLTSTGTAPVDGRVRLLEDGRPTGIEVPVTALGTVLLPLSPLPVGDHALSLELLDSTSYAGSVSPTRTFTVRRATTRVVLPTRLTAGAVVRVPVETTDSPVAAVGALTLSEGTRALATAPVRGGVATLRVPATLAAGRHVLTAEYAGSSTHAGATSPPTTVTVARAARAASSVRGTVRRSGRAVLVRAAVRSTTTATGTVEVLDGRRVVRRLGLGAAARGRVSTTLRGLRPGRHAITVRYLGSSTVAASSRTFRVTVPRR